MSQSAKQSLPNDVAQLRDIAKAQQTRIDELEKLVAIHEEMNRLMRIEKYGAKSEKLNDDQLSFLEEEPGVKPEEIENEIPNADTPSPRKKRQHNPGRVDFPDHLPRVEELVACSAEQCVCGGCGQSTHVIGYEESEVLDVKPAEFFVRVIRRGNRSQGGRKVSTAVRPGDVVVLNWRACQSRGP